MNVMPRRADKACNVVRNESSLLLEILPWSFIPLQIKLRTEAESRKGLAYTVVDAASL